PVLNKKDGLYNSAITLEFSKNEADIYYSIQSGGQNNFNLWLGESLAIQQNDVLNTEIIQSYCEDSVGNRSSVKINSFTILPSVEKHQSLEVLSPVEGIFLNNQLIYIDTTGYKWIRYSFNDVDPATRGTSYINPVLLKKTGDYKLNIAAMPLNSLDVLTREITFSIIDNQNVIINKESGIYTEDISLKFNRNGMHYNLEDRAVLAWDTVLSDTLNLMPVPGVVKYRSLRISNPAEEGEFRYFFILDKRIPAAPLITVASDSPISSDTEVRILGVPGADIFYTIDGSTPDRYSAYYNRPFTIRIPENRSSGSMIIKARAYFSDKSTSIVKSKLLTFDVKKPEKPELTITSSMANKTSFSFSNYSSNRIIFTVTYDGSEPEDPIETSFTGKQDMIIENPNGIATDVRFKAAFIDRAGNITEYVIIDLLKTDTVPPKEPGIIIENKTFTLIGNETIYYKIIKNNIDLDGYQLYESPVVLDFEDSSFMKYAISCFSVDEYGNKSSIAVSKEIKVDKRIPLLPDYSGIINGGIYNNPRSLRFHSYDDIKIYYTVSSDLSPPEDPIPGDSSIINEYLYFDCPVNEIRQYTVKLLASYDNDELVSPPELISFEIDRIAPRAPVITSVINGTIYNEDVKISINDEDEKVWILIKDQIEVEDLNFPYFEAHGILLDNDYIIRQVENTEKKYQLSALSIDKAGNTNISREIVQFSIDKIPPGPPVIIVDDSFSEYIIIRMSSEDLDEIIYEISKDGSYPEEPTKNSLFYQLPLQIHNKNANSIYISARTIDASGNLSDLITQRKITFTNLDLQAPLIHIGKLNSTESSVSFASLTGMKIFLKEGDGSFQEYIDPLVIDLRNRDYIDLFYYSMDNLGNKSSVAVYRIE
ncbi:MAG: chitobiase/beta-hexosaminidase C-terminal domain-containing protein, partial [Spirochaetales bacterium]|nr:chitobiase/beta-hexosaminidase C-terminal domain-containing protein [Spirochaetales bacterium]